MGTHRPDREGTVLIGLCISRDQVTAAPSTPSMLRLQVRDLGSHHLRVFFPSQVLAELLSWGHEEKMEDGKGDKGHCSRPPRPFTLATGHSSVPSFFPHSSTGSLLKITGSRDKSHASPRMLHSLRSSSYVLL